MNPMRVLRRGSHACVIPGMTHYGRRGWLVHVAIKSSYKRILNLNKKIRKNNIKIKNELTNPMRAAQGSPACVIPLWQEGLVYVATSQVTKEYNLHIYPLNVQMLDKGQTS